MAEQRIIFVNRVYWPSTLATAQLLPYYDTSTLGLGIAAGSRAFAGVQSMGSGGYLAGSR